MKQQFSPAIEKTDMSSTEPIAPMDYQDAARRLAELRSEAEELNRLFYEYLVALLTAKIKAGGAS